jgi:hypothetical protein
MVRSVIDPVPESAPRPVFWFQFGRMRKATRDHGPRRFQFLSADASLGRNVTKNDQRPPGSSS